MAVYPSVNISGDVMIGEEAELGTGTQIINIKNKRRQSIVGAGSVVIKDIPEKYTAVASE